MICGEYIWQAVSYTLAISLKGNKLCLEVRKEKKKEEIRGYRGWEAKQNEKDPLHQ